MHAALPDPPLLRTAPAGGGTTRRGLRVLRAGTLLLFFAPLLGTLPAAAQLPERTGPILTGIAPGTRALGIGGAFPLGGRDSDALFAHPGLLDRANGMTAAVQFWGRGGTLAQLSAAGEWWSGGAAVGVRALNYEVGAGGFEALAREESELRERRGTGGAGELAVVAGFGRTVRGVRVGLTATLLQLQAQGRRDATGALGVGAARAFGPVLASVAALNLGPGLSDGSTRVELARELVLGASTVRSAVAGPFDLGPAVEVSFLEDGSVSVGGGVEVAWWPVQGRTFLLRAGGRSVPTGSTARGWTLGGGFQGDRLGVDYALVPFESGPVAHRVGIHLR